MPPISAQVKSSLLDFQVPAAQSLTFPRSASMSMPSLTSALKDRRPASVLKQDTEMWQSMEAAESSARALDNRPFGGLCMSEPVCIELCAGSAKLSNALRLHGLDAVPFDSTTRETSTLLP